MNEFKISIGSTQLALPLKSPKSQQFEEALLLLDVTKSPPLSRQSSPLADLSSDLTSYEIDQSISVIDPPEKKQTDVDLLFAANLLVQNKQHTIKGVEKKKRKTPHVARSVNANGQQRQCNFCLTTATPMWRHGPIGYDDLCNKVFTLLNLVWCEMDARKDLARRGTTSIFC